MAALTEVHRDLIARVLADIMTGVDGPAILLHDRQEFAKRKRQQWFGEAITIYSGIGAFRADQLIVDICRAVEVEVKWLHVGRGTRRGLCWIAGWHMRAIDAELTPDGTSWLSKLERVTKALNRSCATNISRSWGTWGMEPTSYARLINGSGHWQLQQSGEYGEQRRTLANGDGECLTVHG